MNNSFLSLKKVDRIEILTLMDNYVDVLLRNTDIVTRPPLAKGGKIPSDTLLAEHGLSLLVTVHKDEKKHTILFDTGYSRIGVPHNIEQLGVDIERIEAIVLSHGHMDHTGSLYSLLKKVPHRIPLVVHPDAFLAPRYFGLDDGRKLLFPQTLKRDNLDDEKVDILEKKTPSLLSDDMVAVTGEVDRVTDFEKGLPNALLERNGKIEKDPISDDQALIVNLREKGLVVISGCAHAGIINTVRFAKKITGVEKIHTVLGGFHLSGPFFEQIIEQTIKEFKKIDPCVIVPMHCTGWKAIQRFSEEFPTAFILNSVGSMFTLY
ncbi:MAG TPA: MBL fold metallo-hydrolase [Desulfobacteraceae bacterium]|nr:MBL fold metallo-hydrolase [Desulfobacteraceae bacterium]